MQIGNTNYSVKPGNWTLKTPGKVKLACDILLFLSAIAALVPELPGNISKWILFGGVVAKLLSNFISEHIPTPVDATTTADGA
jgi:hypothetical protein